MRLRGVRGRRNRWLDQVARFSAERGARAAALELWELLDVRLLAEGMDELRASKVALRCVKLSAMLQQGVRQRDAAARLGVSERTAKYDARRLRDLVESGALRTSGQPE